MSMASNSENVSALKKHIGYWMRMVSNSVSFSFARKLDASGVTVAEWVILRETYECDESIAPSSIAKLTGLTRGAVSKLIERLVQKKLVLRSEAESDRRFQEIKLTREGKLLVPKLAALADENDELYFSVLSSSERKTLLELLKKTANGNQIKQIPIE